MSNTATKLNLKDLSIGQRFVSAPHTITAEEIKAYAAQFDPQPFHLDEAAARDSIFGGLVASGWHTAALSMRLIVASIPLDCGLIGLGGTINWLKPVRPETTLQVSSEITDITPSRTKPGQAVIGMSCIVTDDAGEKVIAFTSKLMAISTAPNPPLATHH